MANFLNKIKIHNAMQTRNSFDLSHINLTTQAFYSIKPVYSKEIMPNEKIKIDYSQFMRMLPLSEPMMAHCNTVSRAFFVPFRTVWSLWNGFIEGTSAQYNGSNVRPSKVPTFTSQELVYMFYRSEHNMAVEVDSGVAYDFYISSTQRYYRFTPYGRRVYDILLSLGYSFNFDFYNTDHIIEFSALPLLCYLRVYCDWLQNTNYDNLNSYVWTLFDFGNAHVLTSTELVSIFSYITVAQYRTDLFTSAFDNPNGPNSNFPAHSIKNIDFLDSQTVNGNGSQPRTAELDQKLDPNTGEVGFTQNGLYILHALTDYYQRLRAAGTRVLDRYFAEWGVKLSNEKLNRSQYLGGNEREIDILDVMDTSTTGLGEYAGKGIGTLDGSVSYSSEEFGQLIIISYIEPRTSTVQGYDRNNLHMERLDFFSGDFDAIGYQAISKGELFADYKGDSIGSFTEQHTYQPSSIFGYSGRYYEYKCANDKLTGQFRIPSVNGTYDRWHLFRMIPNGNDVTLEMSDLDGSNFKHSLSFTTPTKPTVYNRVFADDSIIADDPFFSRWSFRVKTSLPAKPLFEQYEYASHGNEEIVQIGGTRVTN